MSLLADTHADRPKTLASPSPPKVVASIKPLQLIAQAITQGVVATEVLLPVGASPHHYHLTFADRRQLTTADMLLWIGPDLETFLSKVVADATERHHPNKQQAITMMALPGITLRRHDGSAHAHHGSADTLGHGQYDAHLWLSPANALVMANAIHDALQQQDSNQAHQARYRANLQAFQTALQVADQRNRSRLQAVKHRPFFVFHDAYGYLQDHYGLHIGGHFLFNPQQPPGARHLAQLRQQLIAAGNTCIFREPQWQSAYIDRLTEGLAVKIAVLAPLADDIANTADGYIVFLNALVDSICQCLRACLESHENAKDKAKSDDKLCLNSFSWPRRGEAKPNKKRSL